MSQLNALHPAAAGDYLVEDTENRPIDNLMAVVGCVSTGAVPVSRLAGQVQRTFTAPSPHLHRSHQLKGEWIRRTADHTTHLLAAKTASSESCRQFLGTAPVICWFTRESAILAGVTDTTPPATDGAAATAANALAGWIGTVPAAAVGPTMSDIATAATTPRTQDERKECS